MPQLAAWKFTNSTRTHRANQGLEGVGPKHRRQSPQRLEIPTQSVSEAHFATFPEKLVEPCILAGTSAEINACAQCGAPWERKVERGLQELRPGSKQRTIALSRSQGLE